MLLCRTVLTLSLSVGTLVIGEAVASPAVQRAQAGGAAIDPAARLASTLQVEAFACTITQPDGYNAQAWYRCTQAGVAIAIRSDAGRAVMTHPASVLTSWSISETVATFVCGSGCLIWHVIDARNGDVWTGWER